MFLQFVSAATGIAALIGVCNGLKERTTNNLGNFWNIFTKSITRLLLPLCVIMALILAFNGTPASYDGKDSIVTMQEILYRCHAVLLRPSLPSSTWERMVAAISAPTPHIRWRTRTTSPI